MLHALFFLIISYKRSLLLLKQPFKQYNDGSPPTPSVEACETLASLFTSDATIISAGVDLSQEYFCHLWTVVGAAEHTTDFSQRNGRE